jgi:hypothetical protein
MSQDFTQVPAKVDRILHDAWVIRHALTPETPILTEDELQIVDPSLRRLYRQLRSMATEPVQVRQKCVQFYMMGLYDVFTQADSRKLWEAVRQADLNGSIPPWDTVSIPDRLPTLDDLNEIPDDQKYLWIGRIIRGCLNLLASNPKLGKSTLLETLAPSPGLSVSLCGEGTAGRRTHPATGH